MATAEAQTGHASRLDSLADTIELKEFGVHDGGHLQIEEGCRPPKMAWRPNQRIGVTFLTQESDNIEETCRAMAAFHAEALALGETRESSLDASDLIGIRDELNMDSGEETQLPLAMEVAYMRRLAYLRDEAKQDGYVLNLASELTSGNSWGWLPTCRKLIWY